MLSTANHQRNASKNHSVTSYLLGWLSSKRPQKTNVDKDVEERKSSYTIGGNINWYSIMGKLGDFSKN